MAREAASASVLDPVAAAGFCSSALSEQSPLLPDDSSNKIRYSQVDEGVAVFAENDAGEQAKAGDVYRRRRIINLITVCWVFILLGWNDGSLGPLIPRIQQYYDISYSTVSLIFVMECFGYILGAISNVHLSSKLGFGKTIVFASIIQVFAYCLLVPAFPFPFVVLAYSVYGFAGALAVSQVNAFVASLNDPTSMGILHTCYGTGALLAPLVATPLSNMTHWSYYYFTLLGLAFCNMVALATVFRLKTHNEILIENGYPSHVSTPASASGNRYTEILRLRVVHFLSAFILVYSGIEVTIGGWAVNYMMKRLNGGPKSGYVSTSFFGGLALGRLVLIGVTKKVGERRAIFLYAAIAIGLEIFVWTVPIFIPSAIALALIGMITGPMYPIIMNQCGSLIPGHILAGAIGWISSFGAIGTAVIPMLAGILADARGVTSLLPLLVGMTTLLAVLWSIVVLDHKRTVMKSGESGTF